MDETSSMEVEELVRLAEAKLNIVVNDPTTTTTAAGSTSNHHHHQYSRHPQPTSYLPPPLYASSSSATAPFPSLAVVLQRLDRIDNRLKQIEEKRIATEEAATSQSHHHHHQQQQQQQYYGVRGGGANYTNINNVNASSNVCGQLLPALPPPESNNNSYHSLKTATINLEKRCKSLAAALEEIQFKGTLTDRVRLLENRIGKLNYELDRGCRNNNGTILKPSEEIPWLRQLTNYRKAHDPNSLISHDQMLQLDHTKSSSFNGKGSAAAADDQFEDHIDHDDDPKGAGSRRTKMSSSGSNTKMRKEKGSKANRPWPYKRWFNFGCN